MMSGNLLVPASADAAGLVQKELPVTQRRFRILIDRHDNCLDVMVTPAFASCPASNLRQGPNPRRMILFLVIPFEGFCYHERPPKTLPLEGPSAFLSRSRSVHNSSILMSILSKSVSAEAVEIPAR